MQTMVKLRAYRYLAWLMISIVAVPYLSAGAFAAQRVESVPQSIVVFPLDSGAGVGDSKVVPELNSFLRDGLSVSPRYRTVAFSERLPAVQRLVSLQPDKKTATRGPFAADEAAIGRAVMLAKAMSADILIVGSVDRYVFNGTAGTADVTGKVRLLDGRVGRAIRDIPFEGHAVRAAGDTGVGEAKVRTAAIEDAGRKLIKGITGDEYQAPQPIRTTIVKSEKSSKKSWIPALMLSLGVGLLLSGSGGGSGGSGTAPVTDDTPPAPPF